MLLGPMLECFFHRASPLHGKIPGLKLEQIHQTPQHVRLATGASCLEIDVIFPAAVSANHQTLDFGHTTCTDSQTQEAVSPMLLDHFIGHVMDQIKYQIPVLASFVPWVAEDSGLLPLFVDKPEKVQGLQLLPDPVVQDQYPEF
ncbi:hypothetical protein N7492_001312 [Penicillium capsulatum]|uniref:Uncharacterized protein n=1 Tax=Penicillium capsulatum TaxID=69766 RepID=A0A9W9IUF6_9EURO|nr:hypothetical protein N7492_001312 [Penicillium capsulatum]